MRVHPPQRAIHGTLLILASMLAPLVVHGGEWRIQPRLSVFETYTDNPRLVDSSRNTGSDWLTSLAPGISVTGTGRRLQMNTEYTAQKQIFANNSDLSQMTNLLQSNARAEIVREQFFISAYANMFPTVRNNLGQISNRNRNARIQTNRTDVITYGFAPEIRHHLGNYVNLSARVNWSDTATGDTGNDIGSGQDFETRLAADSGRYFQRVTWGSTFSRRESNGNGNSPGGGSNFQRWNNTLHYRINRLVRLDSSFGYEINDFSTNGNGLNNGFNWQLGATLTPSPRTSLSGSFGERAFGSTMQFSFNHRWRRFIVSGQYNEELRTTSEVLRQQQVFSVLDPFGVPIIDPLTNGDPTIPLDQIGLTNDVFISRDFNSSIGYNRKHDNFSMRVSHRTQESTRTSVSDSAMSFGGAWSHTLSYRLSAGVQADYQNRTSSNVQRSSDFVSISPFVNYTIGPHVRSRLSYQYMDSVSADTSDDFTENSVTGSLSFAF